MKIILLPGMNGTGKLFEPFRQFLSEPTVAIPLPQSGSQSYESLPAMDFSNQGIVTTPVVSKSLHF